MTKPQAQIWVHDEERHVFYSLAGQLAVAPCDHTAAPAELAPDDPDAPMCPICRLYLAAGYPGPSHG
jgi:hypothetical protein